MKMALTDGMVRIIEADAIQKTIIKSWNQMRWIRGQQMYEGIASAELLNKLASEPAVQLPRNAGSRRGPDHQHIVWRKFQTLRM